MCEMSTKKDKTQEQSTTDNPEPSAADWYNNLTPEAQLAYSQYAQQYYTAYQGYYYNQYQQHTNAEYGANYNAGQEQPNTTQTKKTEKKRKEKRDEDDDEEGDDRTECKLCNCKFKEEKAYLRHIRGMIHTRKVLANNVKEGKEKFVIDFDCPTKPLVEMEVPEHIKMLEGVDPNKRDLNPDDLGENSNSKRYVCQICNITTTDGNTLRTHLDGKKHKKALKAKNVISRLPTTSDTSTGTKVKMEETGHEALVQATLDAATEPLIGLDFITEFVSAHTEPRYVCNLCSSKCDPRMLVNHITGQKHRVNYLKNVRSEMYGDVFAAENNRTLYHTLLKTKALLIEQEDGRKQVKQKREMLDDDLANLPILRPTCGNIYGSASASRTSIVGFDGAYDSPIPSKRKRPDQRGPALTDQQRSTLFGQPMSYEDLYMRNDPKKVAEPGQGLTQNIDAKALLQTLSKAAIKNDEDANFAFQITNALTQALLEYRMNKSKQGGSTPIAVTIEEKRNIPVTATNAESTVMDSSAPTVSAVSSRVGNAVPTSGSVTIPSLIKSLEAASSAVGGSAATDLSKPQQNLRANRSALLSPSMPTRKTVPDTETTPYSTMSRFRSNAPVQQTTSTPSPSPTKKPQSGRSQGLLDLGTPAPQRSADYGRVVGLGEAGDVEQNHAYDSREEPVNYRSGGYPYQEEISDRRGNYERAIEDDNMSHYRTENYNRMSPYSAYGPRYAGSSYATEDFRRGVSYSSSYRPPYNDHDDDDDHFRRPGDPATAEKMFQKAKLGSGYI